MVINCPDRETERERKRERERGERERERERECVCVCVSWRSHIGLTLTAETGKCRNVQGCLVIINSVFHSILF